MLFVVLQILKIYEKSPEWTASHTAALVTEYLVDFFACNFHYAQILHENVYMNVHDCLEKLCYSVTGYETFHLLTTKSKICCLVGSYDSFVIKIQEPPRNRFAISTFVWNGSANCNVSGNLLQEIFLEQKDQFNYFSGILVFDSYVTFGESITQITVQSLLEKFSPNS